MAERLSSSDMSSLLAERGPIHVNVGGTMIMEGEPPGFEELLGHVSARLSLIPRYRQRVTEAPLVQITNPSWRDDPRFDLRWHVRRAALPRPGSRAELRELVGQIISQPLDLSRPLWQLHLIEGLEGGGHAYLSTTHHALVDGVSAIDVGTVLLDPDPEVRGPAEAEPWEPEETDAAMLFASEAAAVVRRPIAAARRAAHGALSMPLDTATRVMRTAEGFAGLAAGGPAAPRSTLNVEVGRDRRVAWASADLAALKGARAVEGSTVNDVILAVVSGALARFLKGRGDPVPERLVALVPVSIRRAEEAGGLGNRITSIQVPLPLGLTDPLERLSAIHSDTERLKASEQARAASLIIEATGWTPPTINRVLADAISRPLTWNLVVSNVPGPQTPFFLLGRRLVEVYPCVPLSPQNHALSVGVVSYDGRVFFGLNGDRDALADIEDLATAIGSALAEQTAAA
ncbi:MAG: wax ester/triacylglycerol synthase family O-acyltransferase [Solirubrobacterales bacterium]